MAVLYVILMLVMDWRKLWEELSRPPTEYELTLYKALITKSTGEEEGLDLK